MASTLLPLATGDARVRAVAQALRLERVTLGWMVVEAVGAIAAGVMARSTLLIAFGIDSVIELASAVVLYRRLQFEATGADMCAVEASEARAGKIGGTLLYLLAAYVVGMSGYTLLHHGSAEGSPIGLAIAIVAAFGMPLLARAKLRLASQLGSRALRADAMETFTCGYMSWVLLIGLAANALLHWWWLDGAAALVLVPLLLREAREAFTGECHCDDGH